MAVKSNQNKPRIPPKVFNEARNISLKSGIPVKFALRVASGTETLSEVLRELQLRDQLDSLVKRRELYAGYANEVLKGNWTVARARLETRLKQIKRTPDYSRCYFAELAAAGQSAGVALVRRRLLVGQVAQNRPFEVVIRDREGTEETILKHNIKFYFDAGDKKRVMKQVKWGPGDSVEVDFLKRIQNRKDVKARVFLEAMEGASAVSWKSVEGDLVRGTVAWFGRFEVALELPRGQRVVVMRHAVDAVE